MTKPACTPLVSAALENCDRWNSAASAGMTADAENHSAIAATWQNAMIAIEAAFDRGRSISGCSRQSAALPARAIPWRPGSATIGRAPNPRA